MPTLVALWLCGVAAQSDVRFAMTQIDAGAAESADVADFNNDGELDIVSAESWYEAPRWTKRPIRTIPVTTHSYGICWFEQRADGTWPQHVIDHSWSHSHASVLADINGDGRPDLVSGKRFQARNAPAPGDNDPLGLYWYEFTQGAKNAVTWTRHTIDYGSKAGGGLQMAVRDIDGDGDMDVVSGGKSGLFLAENLTRSQGPTAQGVR
jgi:hypothetical protein